MQSGWKSGHQEAAYGARRAQLYRAECISQKSLGSQVSCNFPQVWISHNFVFWVKS